jgi:hypothetical protein
MIPFITCYRFIIFYIYLLGCISISNVKRFRNINPVDINKVRQVELYLLVGVCSCAASAVASTEASCVCSSIGVSTIISGRNLQVF